jgi:hypothetical protein
LQVLHTDQAKASVVAARVVLKRDGFAPWKKRLDVAIQRAPRCEFKIQKLRAPREADCVTFGKYTIEITNKAHDAAIRYVVMKGEYIPGSDGKDIDWTSKDEAKPYTGPFDVEGFESVVQIKAFAKVDNCTHLSLVARALLRPLLTLPEPS